MTTSSNQHAKQEIERTRESQSSCLIWLAFVLLFTFIVFAICFGAVLPAFKRSEQFAQKMELIQIDHALNRYEVVLGEMPPNAARNEIQSHLNAVYNFSGSIPPNIDTLDERELVIFWLGGKAWEILGDASKSDRVFYDFDDSRMTDVDNDGFPEFVDRRGNFYILRDGQTFVQDRSDGTVISIEDLAPILKENGE